MELVKGKLYTLDPKTSFSAAMNKDVDGKIGDILGMLEPGVIILYLGSSNNNLRTIGLIYHRIYHRFVVGDITCWLSDSHDFIEAK